MITVTAGHNQDGKVACGAIGLIKESTENRIVTHWIKYWMAQEKEQCIDCTVNDGISQNDILVKCVDKMENTVSTLDLHIHFNSSNDNDLVGDGKNKGTEIYMDKKCKNVKIAEEILCRMEKLGFTSRGVKNGSDFYVIRKRPETSMLLEVCFVNDHDDVALYNKVQAKEIARNIVSAILGREIKEENEVEEKKNTKEIAIYLKTLKIGDKGNTVLAAQVLLNAKGCKGADGKPLTLDGKDGNNTEFATKSFQRKYKIPITGKVDFQTWNKLLK